jgi:signal peptidase I
MNKDHNKYAVIKDIGFTLLAEGKILKIKADGYSMYPSIKPGSIIFIEPLVQEASPSPGEIIAWKRESGFVVHRLIRILKRGKEVLYFTRGDSCTCEDKPVTRDLIAGKVIRVENQNKHIKEGEQLISRPYYLINRLYIWFLLRFKRIFNLYT